MPRTDPVSWADAARRVAALFGLVPDRDLSPVLKSSENFLFLFGESRYVVRASWRRSVAQVEAEVLFTELLRREGFDRLPVYRRMPDGRAAVAWAGLTWAVYSFMPGLQFGSLDEPSFAALATGAGELVVAERRVAQDLQSAQLLKARPTFPSIALVGARARSIVSAAGTVGDAANNALQGLLDLPELKRDILMHGDLHVGNLVWASPGILLCVIDFDDCCWGNPLLELLVVARSSCFVDNRLVEDRLVAMLQLMQDVAFMPVHTWSKIVDYLLYVCFYFLVETSRIDGSPRLAEFRRIESLHQSRPVLVRML